MTTPDAAGNAGTNGAQGGGANSGNPPAAGSVTPPAANGSATQAPPATGLAASLGVTEGQAPPANQPPAVDYDKLDFKKPEGYKGADSDIAFVRDLAKSTGLSAEQAQKLFDRHAAVIADEEAAITREVEQTRADHIATLKSDPEFGGPKFAESITKADQFLAKYDTDGKLLAKLKQFGLEHEPDLVRVFMRAAAASSEGKFVQAGKAPAQSRAATAQEMYPSMPNA
jgi:hypothetical protein